MNKYTMLVFPKQLPLFSGIIYGIGGTICPASDFPTLSNIEVPKNIKLETLQKIRDGLEELSDHPFSEV